VRLTQPGPREQQPGGVSVKLKVGAETDVAVDMELGSETDQVDRMPFMLELVLV
jgi:hypothetical protein